MRGKKLGAEDMDVLSYLFICISEIFHDKKREKQGYIYPSVSAECVYLFLTCHLPTFNLLLVTAKRDMGSK